MALVPSQETKLFVGNLPSDITVEQLNYVFANYGVVTKSHVMDSSRSKSGQACAFVNYSTPEAAAVAIQTLNNVYKIRADAKEAISVSVAKGSGQTQGSAIASSLVAAAGGGVAMQPVVSALAGLTQPGFAQPGLAQLGLAQPAFAGFAQPDFSQLGFPQPGLGQPGFAQPSFTQPGFGQPGLTQPDLIAPALAQAAALQMPMQASLAGLPTALPQPCKLFVGDLPADIAKEALVAVFSTYGTVTDVHMMTGKSRSGAACALVEYSNQIEAQTAVATLHQKYEIRVGTGMITVRTFEGNKGKGKGGAPAPAAPLTFDPAALLLQPDAASLRYTPY